MKKIIGIILCAAMCAGLFCACEANTDSGKLNIVTTIFPEYDWVKNIIGEDSEKFELTMLLDSGVDLHSFQPTADDIIKISTCDMFIYVGGESDEWVDDALKESANKNMIIIDLLDVLGENAKAEEAVEGMELEETEEEPESQVAAQQIIQVPAEEEKETEENKPQNEEAENRMHTIKAVMVATIGRNE